MKRTRMIVFTIAALVCIGLFPHQQEKVQALYIPGPEPHGIVSELLVAHTLIVQSSNANVASPDNVPPSGIRLFLAETQPPDPNGRMSASLPHESPVRETTVVAYDDHFPPMIMEI